MIVYMVIKMTEKYFCLDCEYIMQCFAANLYSDEEICLKNGDVE